MNNSLKNNPQKILNGEVHNWYRIALGFSDQLVDAMINRFELKPGDTVLDPFLGSGTTMVQCKKKGIKSIGIDANPSSYFAAKVKTDWSPSVAKIKELTKKIEKKYSLLIKSKAEFKTDPTYKYLHESGMLERGWISQKPLQKSIYLKKAILALKVPKKYKDLFLLALIDEVVADASNVKFGPQLYCVPPKKNAKVLEGFLVRVERMTNDLTSVKKLPLAETKIYIGDSRLCNSIIDPAPVVSAVICSPPYPGEHDYTRHARLELAFLEEVTDRETVQKLKRQMIRSSTKNIYKGDNDAELVKDNLQLKSIVKKIDKRAQGKTHGFARLYSTVVMEYFGGMKRHLKNLHEMLPSGAKCAYVVGDQSSYLRVHIPTAKILAGIVNELGYECLDILPWRTAWSSTTSKKVDENILIFRKI